MSSRSLSTGDRPLMSSWPPKYVQSVSYSRGTSILFPVRRPPFKLSPDTSARTTRFEYTMRRVKDHPEESSTTVVLRLTKTSTTKKDRFDWTENLSPRRSLLILLAPIRGWVSSFTIVQVHIAGISKDMLAFLAEVRDVVITNVDLVRATSDFSRAKIGRRVVWRVTHVSYTRAAANDGNVSVCLKDRCEQVYERRQQITKGPDKRRNRESTWLAAVAALDTPEAFPAAAYGLGLRVPAKSQLLSARYVNGYANFCTRLLNLKAPCVRICCEQISPAS